MKKHSLKALLLAVLVLPAVALLTACDEMTNVQPISISQTSVTIDINEQTTLTASGENAKYVDWTTSNAAVATVENGLVKGQGTGSATITAKTQDGATATCNVTVTDKYCVYFNDGSNPVSDWDEVGVEVPGKTSTGLTQTQFEGNSVWAITGNGAEINHSLTYGYSVYNYDLTVSYDIYLNAEALTGTSVTGEGVVGLDVGVYPTYDYSSQFVFGNKHDDNKLTATVWQGSFANGEEIDGNKWYTVTVTFKCDTAHNITLEAKLTLKGSNDVIKTVTGAAKALEADQAIYTNVYCPTTGLATSPLAYLDNYRITATAKQA